MTPLRITLDGFLCYADEQVVDLTGGPLLLLCGPNGSGKSAVFDALTFALFGAHRGGETNYGELINKGCDRAVVEVELSAAGRTWRVRRTLRRSKTGGSAQHTRQVFAADPAAPGGWRPEVGTDREAGLAEWVAAHVGLTLETFTASVLLRQGEADRLLSARRTERHEILRGLTDLDRYVRLHEQADGRARDLRAAARAAAARLDALAPVTAEQIAAAEAAAAEAAKAVEAAEAAVQAAAAGVEQSRRWEEISAGLEGIKVRHRGVRSLLDKADAIETDARRLAGLKAVLPKLGQADDLRRRIGAAESEARQAAAGIARLADEAAALRDAAAADEAEIRRLGEAGRAAQEELAAASALLVELTKRAAEAAAAGRLRAEAAALRRELSGLPADPAAEAAAAEADLAAGQSARDAVPHVRQMLDAGREGAEAADAATRAEAEAADAAGALAAAEARAADTAGRLAGTEAADRAAADALASARTTADAARRALADLDGLDGAAECRACGRPLTPQHLAAERAHRTAERDSAAAALKAAESASAAAAAEARRLRAEGESLREQAAQARRRRDAAAAEAQRQRAAAAKAEGRRRSASNALPESLRSQWSGDAGRPHAEDLARLEQLAAGLADARVRAKRAGEAEARHRDLGGRLARLESELAGHPGAAADAAALQAELDRTEAGRKQLQRQADGLRRACEDRRREAAGRADRLAAVETESARLSGAVEASDRNRRDWSAELESVRAELSAAGWRPVEAEEFAALTREAKRLTDAGAEQRLSELEKARGSAAELERRKAELDLQAAAVAGIHRRPVAAAEDDLRTARIARTDAEAARRRAEGEVEQLGRRRRERLEAEAAKLDLEGRHSVAAKLAGLLGREGLQRHRMRTAEERITAEANAVLDRLSAGGMRLRLRRGEDADAVLDLEAVTSASGGQAIPTAFLSGSQRFRAAVALALAIGRWAAGRQVGGGSVLIDEGFGSLDAAGQEVMLAELQRLRNFVGRVVVVSHLESFARTLPEGRRFELVDGRTRVTPLGG